MMKRARIAVDCCGETLRIIWSLKTGFPFQSEGAFKQYTEEVLILTQVGLVFFTASKTYEVQAFRIGELSVGELVIKITRNKAKRPITHASV